jgi:hypothetical protein
MNDMTPSAAYEAAGRAWFRGIYGNEKAAVADVFEIFGGKVAARFIALRDWDAVELEGFEDAKHLASLADADGIYLRLCLCEIVPDDPAAAYRCNWSAAADAAWADWDAIREIAERVLRDAA